MGLDDALARIKELEQSLIKEKLLVNHLKIEVFRMMKPTEKMTAERIDRIVDDPWKKDGKYMPKNNITVKIDGKPVTAASVLLMSERELQNLPEISDVVLWAEEEEPTSIIDSQGLNWFLGMYNGKMYKKKGSR